MFGVYVRHEGGHDPQVGQAAHASPVLRASLHLADGPADLGATKRMFVGAPRIDAFPELLLVGVESP
jgi:hypothetical protein